MLPGPRRVVRAVVGAGYCIATGSTTAVARTADTESRDAFANARASGVICPSSVTAFLLYRNTANGWSTVNALPSYAIGTTYCAPRNTAGAPSTANCVRLPSRTIHPHHLALNLAGAGRAVGRLHSTSSTRNVISLMTMRSRCVVIAGVVPLASVSVIAVTRATWSEYETTSEAVSLGNATSVGGGGVVGRTDIVVAGLAA